ncbi:hypothetical protein AGLY_007953 [Aphis glycines]|uniref:Uncharacterized protein n=1 Tax=Aphis glycines TaxID=307491 RepID=A0A6G0TLZ0_APHGL|nr:hypothetical protein AGLY_007953 [Aphis glycines]
MNDLFKEFALGLFENFNLDPSDQVSWDHIHKNFMGSFWKNLIGISFIRSCLGIFEKFNGILLTKLLGIIFIKVTWDLFDTLLGIFLKLCIQVVIYAVVSTDYFSKKRKFKFSINCSKKILEGKLMENLKQHYEYIIKYYLLRTKNVDILKARINIQLHMFPKIRYLISINDLPLVGTNLCYDLTKP